MAGDNVDVEETEVGLCLGFDEKLNRKSVNCLVTAKLVCCFFLLVFFYFYLKILQSFVTREESIG